MPWVAPTSWELLWAMLTLRGQGWGRAGSISVHHLPRLVQHRLHPHLELWVPMHLGAFGTVQYSLGNTPKVLGKNTNFGKILLPS